MVPPASRESNFGISTSYEAFANFKTMAAKEYKEYDSCLQMATVHRLVYICCAAWWLRPHSWDWRGWAQRNRATKSFWFISKSNGGEGSILQTKDGNRLRQSGFYCKDRSHLLPSRRHPTWTRTYRFPPSAKVACQSSKGKVYPLNVIVSNLRGSTNCTR